jgi:hypothetical protein
MDDLQRVYGLDEREEGGKGSLSLIQTERFTIDRAL